MSFSPPSFVSPTSAFTERTSRVAGLRERPLHEPFDGCAHRQRIGQRDRRLDGAELLHLRGPGELAERIADEHSAGHLVLEHVALVRDDDGHARCGSLSPSIERGVADRHAGDVGDGVERPGLERRQARARCRGRAGAVSWASSTTAAHNITSHQRASCLLAGPIGRAESA